MFDSGRLQICSYDMSSVAGGMPEERLVVRTAAFFGDRTIRAARIYEARGADSQIDRVVRVPFDTDVSVGDYVIIGGDQYRVDIVDPIFVKRDARAVELTLIKLEEYLNVDTFTG